MNKITRRLVSFLLVLFLLFDAGFSALTPVHAVPLQKSLARTLGKLVADGTVPADGDALPGDSPAAPVQVDEGSLSQSEPAVPAPASDSEPVTELELPPEDPVNSTPEPGSEEGPVGDGKTEDGGVIMRIIIPPDTPTDTYIFNDANGDEIHRQVVAVGDTLIQPATLPEGAGGTFLGWYIGDTKLNFNADGKLIIESVTGAEITVTPKFATVYFVTFYDADNVTVLSRRPVELAQGATSGTLDFSDLTATSTNPNQEFAYWSLTIGGTKVDSPVTVSADMNLYPVFSTGYWITFNANRTPAMAGVNVDYTAPKYVKEGESTVAPTAPNANSPAFTFAGWYTDAACQNAFTWGGTISADLTLYAKWDQHQVPFTIIVWTQKVNDAKNAAPESKTYDAFQVYTDASLVADAGATVQLSGSAPNFSYGALTIARPSGAFVYNAGKSNTSVTVANDGSSTINVYYDRALLTIDFHDNGYYGAEDGEYTGLYGQTLAQNGYTWPAGMWMNYEESDTLTFLDAFIFDNLTQYGSTTYINLYYHTPFGYYTINHYKQNVDGSTYPSTPTNSTNTTGGTFNITNKYNGFTAAQYRKYWRGSWTAWQPAVAGSTSVSNYVILEIRYTRNKYQVYFYDGSQLKQQNDKYFEASLSDLASVAIESPNLAEKTFGGWALVDGVTDPTQAVDLSTMNMPANNLSLYAIWVPVAYHVLLDVNGGSMNPAQSMSFWPEYGEKIDGTWMNLVTKERYVLVGWYSANGAGTVWNFDNGITADLCDEGPVYDEEHHNYYYTLHLKAKWRLNVTISIVYDLAGGSGTFEDTKKYVQDGTAQILSGIPTPPNANYMFAGWLDDKGKLYQPGEAITLSEDLIVTEEGQTPTVTLTAQYTTKVPQATITYHANGGTGDDKVEGPYDWNANVSLLGANTFTREGYELSGWNTAAGCDGTAFALGASVLVSAMGTVYTPGEAGNNDLYACWNPYITITSDSKSWTYDGTSHTYQKYTVTYGSQTIVGTEGQTVFDLPDGSTLTITPTDTGLNGVKNVADTAANNNTYTATTTSQATIKTETFGTLEITKAPVTITTGSATKEYDGSALTNAEASITGLVNGETATVTATGSQTEVGSSDNTYSIDWGTTDSNNYEITETLGKLTVTTNATAEVKLIAADATKVYDGTALEKTDGVTWEGLPDGFTVEATSTGSQTNAGSSANVVNDGYVIKDGNGVDVTANFTNVTKVDGTLTVTKAPVTITTGSQSWMYDGDAHTNSAVTADALLSGDTLVATATGSVTNVADTAAGNNPIAADYKIMRGTEDVTANYDITAVAGTLTITPREVILTSATDSKVYDGTALTNGTVTVTGDGFADGEGATYNVTGTQTAVGSSSNAFTYTLNDGTLADNYEITRVEGTLTVLELKPTSTPAPIVTIPYTGDDGRLALYALLMVSALVLFGGLQIVSRKRR